MWDMALRSSVLWERSECNKKRSNEKVKKISRTRMWDMCGRNAEQTDAVT
jgi:hypothetical protein